VQKNCLPNPIQTVERNPLLKAAGGRHFFALPMVSTWFEEEPTRLLQACKNSRSANISELSARKCPENSNGFTDD
jgi:hypothetical protein